MSRYRKQIEIAFEVSREPSGWIHDTLDMPQSLATWLEARGFSGVVTICVDLLIWGFRGGPHGWDDAEDYRCLGTRVGSTPVPIDVANHALGGEWSDELDRLVRTHADQACAMF